MRVLELAQIMAGPTCGMMLADMGADVIKVEKLPGGDDARGYREPRVNGVSAPFLMMNRNKRGIALDLKHPRGREILLRIVADADVLIENFRRGTLEKLGLAYDVLAAANPALIYCAISGFGRDGPLADKGGFDLIAQGFAGLMAITGEPGRPAGEERQPRLRHQCRASSPRSACWPRMRITLKTGRGQIVDTSLLRSGAAADVLARGDLLRHGRIARAARARRTSSPRRTRPFTARDGWINIGGANQANWERIADVLGHPEWRDDPRFATNTARMEHLRRRWSTLMNAVLRHRTRAEWIASLDAAGVPAGRCIRSARH